MLSSALSTGAVGLDLVGLVGLVGSRRLIGAPTFAPHRLNTAAPAPLHFGGFGGFGGFYGVVEPHGRAEISAEGLPTGCTDQPRIGGFGGFHGVVEPYGRAEISAEGPPTGCTDQPRIGGFGGFHEVVEPYGRAEISAAAPQIAGDTSTAEDAEALLRHLRELGISVELEASGALRVTPASLLTQELRDAIKAQRDALAELLDAAGLRDDRRRCSECRHFRPYGGCAEAARGNMPGVNPRMIPMKDVLQRCDWFKPHRDFGGDY